MVLSWATWGGEVMTQASERLLELRAEIEEIVPEETLPEIIKLLDQYDRLFLELIRRS